MYQFFFILLSMLHHNYCNTKVSGFFVCVCNTGSVAPGKLRDRRRCFAAPLDHVQSLLAPLQRAQAGARERCLVWQADPFRIRRAADPSVGHKVTLSITRQKYLKFMGGPQ